MGRPSEYKEEYCEEILKYFDIEPHFETPVITTYKDGTTKEEIKFIPVDLPTLAGFAKKIGKSRDTLNQWSKDHEEFSDAIKRAKDCQESILVTNGLKGLYAQPFAIMASKNIIHWRDKQEDENNNLPNMIIFNINGNIQPDRSIQPPTKAISSPPDTLQTGV